MPQVIMNSGDPDRGAETGRISRLLGTSKMK